MSPTVQFILCALASYMVGAIPFGLLIARSRGVDIRAVGSGNIGATNVFRAVGKPYGIAVYLLDMGKGLCGACLLPALIARGSASTELAIVSGFMAVIGHNWPVYLGFKGGKGIATTSGVLLGLAPGAVVTGLCVWAAVFFSSRYVSLGSILASASVAVYAWIAYAETDKPLAVALTVLALIGILRHRTNIRRLLNGTENRFQRKHKPPN